MAGTLTSGGSYSDLSAPPALEPDKKDTTYLNSKLSKRSISLTDEGDMPLTEHKLCRHFVTPSWKRVLDLTCILASLPLWLPVMAIISVWIKIVSPGAVLFRQVRVGLGGRRFTILKFRSMKPNAETSSHNLYLQKLIESGAPMAKLDALGDPRLIPGGKWLRSLGLDELPQLFNVILGDMSLVGPRPCTTNEFERYSETQKRRVSVAPGLTGYWQVNGKNKTTFQQMIELDLRYAEHLSLPMDLAILMATIPAMLLQCVESRGAAAKTPRMDDHAAPPPAAGLLEPAAEGVH